MRLSEHRRFLGRNASILLDILRFLAALAVALTHMPHRLVAANGFINERAGNTAVCVFFVLSGFVIRFVTVQPSTSGREYWIDRVSRIYSVVAPALVLTLLLEGVAYLHAPIVYRPAADPFLWSDVPLQFVQNLTFTVGWWGWGATPLSNGPFWSLSFECVYYALYGLLRYAPRARWWLVPLLLLLSGPSIALLFPVWLLGVLLYEAYVGLHERAWGLALAAGVLAAYLGVLAVFRRQVLHWLHATEVAERAAALTRAMAGFAWGRSLFHGATLHWLDRFSVSFYLTGSLLAVSMLPALLALDRLLPAGSRSLAGRIRLVADSTFTLYVIHLPFFIFVVTFAGGPLKSWTGGLCMLLAAIGISIALARVFDGLKDRMRASLRRRFPPREPIGPGLTNQAEAAGITAPRS